MKKRFLALVLCLSVLFTMFAFNASAATRTVSDNGSGTLSLSKGGYFSGDTSKTSADVSYGKKWELYAYFDSGNSILRFGFDTYATNEDYAYGFHKNYSHQATVANSTYSKQTSNQAAKNLWTSKVDVHHANKPVWSLLF